MAEKRMYSRKITDGDEFISMPSSAQALYFHLNQGADDDGFNNQVQLAMLKAHASADDVCILLSKSFIIRFENGVIVIKHWRMNNTLRKDRYTPTNYQEELHMLGIKSNGSYTLNLEEASWLPNGCQMVAVDKNRIDKNRVGEKSNDPATDFSFNAEKAFSDTFALYPKKENFASARLSWMDLLLKVIEPNRKDIAMELAYGLKMYLADYIKRNPDDAEYKYIPKFDKWIKENADYWILQYEQSQKNGGDVNG